MNISSVVIRANPDKIDALQAALRALPGVEIHAVTAEARLAVTLEDSSSGRAADTYLALHELPGVLAVTLIYQYDDAGDGPDGGLQLPPGLLAETTAESTARPAA